MVVRRKAKKIKKTKAKNKIEQRVRRKTGRIIKATRKIKEKIPARDEAFIEKRKFFLPEVVKAAPPSFTQDLPAGYGKDKIVLQVRDPWWIHAYWETSQNTWDKLKGELKEAIFSAKKILRVYDISQIIFDGTNAHRFFDLEVTQEANSWYIDTAGPGRSWCVDLGLRLANGEFIRILRSNTVHTPLDGPSLITDEEWMIPEENFARLYGMGFGLGQSSPVGRGWQEKIKKQISITSVTSPVNKAPCP